MDKYWYKHGNFSSGRIYNKKLVMLPLRREPRWREVVFLFLLSVSLKNFQHEHLVIPLFKNLRLDLWVLFFFSIFKEKSNVWFLKFFFFLFKQYAWWLSC